MSARTDPSKHGLELSRDMKVLAIAAVSAGTSAPRKQMGADC